MGWPRKQGFLGGRVIDTLVLDSSLDQMIDWAASIGAGRPKLALHILAYLFRDKDWEGADAPNIKTFIREMNDGEWGKVDLSRSPHEIVEHLRFEKHFGQSINAKYLTSKEFSEVIEPIFLYGLLFGLSNPHLFELWYSAHLREYKQKLPNYVKSGLNVGQPRSLSEYYSDSEQIVRDFEREFGNLPTIPSKLLSDAKELEIEI